MKLIESDEAMKHRELIDIYVEATLQTKHITSALHDDSFLYNSLFKVFTVFVQELDDDDEDPELMAAPEIKHDDIDGDGSMQSDSIITEPEQVGRRKSLKMSMRERGSTVKSLGERRISLDDVPLFLQYLKVSRDDDDFIENCLNKLQVLNYSDKYLKKGMLFRELLDVLVDCGLL